MTSPNHRISHAGLFGAPHPPPSSAHSHRSLLGAHQPFSWRSPLHSTKTKSRRQLAPASLAHRTALANKRRGRSRIPSCGYNSGRPNPLHASVHSTWELLCYQVQEELFCVAIGNGHVVYAESLEKKVMILNGESESRIIKMLVIIWQSMLGCLVCNQYFMADVHFSGWHTECNLPSRLSPADETSAELTRSSTPKWALRHWWRCSCRRC